MKKLLLCVGLVVLFASSTWAAPVGPGGRIYFTRYEGSSSAGADDNQVYLFRVDVDTSWAMTPASVAAGANNVMIQDTALNGGSYSYRSVPPMLSPEVIYPRANPDGTATGDAGEIWVCSAPDTVSYWEYDLITPTGLSSATSAVLHPALYEGGSDPHTGSNSVTGNVGDASGTALGRAAGVSVWGGGGSSAVWNDTDANKDLTDDCDTFDYPGWNALPSGDPECGGAPNDSSDEDTIWAYGGYSQGFNFNRYTGDYNVTHTWSGATSLYDPKIPGGAPAYTPSGGLAVGDTDGDGNTDLYFMCTSAQVASASIIRVADLNGNAKIDNAEVDICKVIYNDDTLAGAENNVGGGDVELIKDPATGKWTLLLLYGGNAWTATDGKIFAVELADNGDYAGTSDGVVVVATGIETAGPGYALGYSLPHVEFDADPGGVIPEPGTMLLIGTGVLGLVGYIRRRRMK